VIENELLTVEETQKLIKSGRPLLLAADGDVLATLDRGNWIGGSIPYFMTRDGGIHNSTKVFVTSLPSSVNICSTQFYTEDELCSVNRDGAEQGASLSFIIVPYRSAAHMRFAAEAPQYEKYLTHPLIGWISGTDLAEIDKVPPTVFLGDQGKRSESDAVVMHCRVAEGMIPFIDIINIFEQDPFGDSIRFPQSGFVVKSALINGTERQFYDYVTERRIDTRLPLISSYYGAMINLSFEKLDDDNKEVVFYSPVDPNREYCVSKSVADYAEAFRRMSPPSVSNALFSCNCILNYRHGNLEGEKVGGLFGPITFGEIAYRLLNQTLVYVTLESTNTK
jgi:hypothetical protein